MVFNDIAIFLVAWFGQLLRWHPSLTYERMEVLAKAIMKAGGGGCQRVWGSWMGLFAGFVNLEGTYRIKEECTQVTRRGGGSTGRQS